MTLFFTPFARAVSMKSWVRASISMFLEYRAQEPKEATTRLATGRTRWCSTDSTNLG